MIRGEIRGYTYRPPDKRRPVLLLTRNEVLSLLHAVIAVPATRTIRGIGSEVVLTPDDGLPTLCALNFDPVGLAEKDRIGTRIAALPPHRWPEVRAVLLTATGFHTAEADA